MHLKNFKKVLAAFGVLALLLSQNSAFSVLAEEKGPAQVGEQLTGDEVKTGDEVDDGDEVKTGDEVNDGDEVKTGDEIQDGSGLTTGNETEDDEDNENGGIQLLSLEDEPLPVADTIQAPTDLAWTDAGAATFTNPNDFPVWCQVQLYKGEARVGVYGNEKGNWFYVEAHQTSPKFDLFPMVSEPGDDYKFRVIIAEELGSEGPVNTANVYSGTKSFYMASDTLPTPTVTVTGDGKVHCEVPETYKDRLLHFGYVVREGVGSKIIKNFGGEHFLNGDTYQEDMDVLNTGGRYGTIETNPKYDYYVSVCAYTSNPSTCNSSDYSGWVKILAATESSEETVSESSQSSGESKSEPVVEEWKPSTPEETERYAAYGRETVACTAAAGSAYPVTVANAMQGSKCFDSFKAALSDYTIGRTYNIMPSGKKVYHMDQKVRMTLTIPTALQGSGRIFKVICVTENGRPIVLNDLDSAEKTITFETDSFYAFALAYKDLK